MANQNHRKRRRIEPSHGQQTLLKRKLWYSGCRKMAFFSVTRMENMNKMHRGGGENINTWPFPGSMAS
jgi:hypothetical protein